MAYLSEYQYYDNAGAAPSNANWGSYQYVSLSDIVNNFLLMYSGNHGLVNNEERYKILFHAKRGIQELNYDYLWVCTSSLKIKDLLLNLTYFNININNHCVNSKLVNQLINSIHFKLYKSKLIKKKNLK